MENQAMSIFMIGLAIPIMLFGARMGRWSKDFSADAVRRAQEGRTQLDGQTISYWTDHLNRSVTALYRYRRLLRAELAGELPGSFVDNRPWAEKAPDPETYAVRVLVVVGLVSMTLASMVLSASGSVVLTLSFLVVCSLSGVAAVWPLLSPNPKRKGNADKGLNRLVKR
jgi:hypothetical protein